LIVEKVDGANGEQALYARLLRTISTELLILPRSRLEDGKFDSKQASSYQLPRMTFLNIFPSVLGCRASINKLSATCSST